MRHYVRIYVFKVGLINKKPPQPLAAAVFG